MSIHAITFRIHQDGTYAQRYESVVSAIKGQTTTTYWAESTSFFLIESGENSTGIANAIDANSTFAADRDLLLVINLSQKGYTALGKVTDNDLSALMSRR